MIFGSDGMGKLKNSRVAVFGIGGVGGYAVEALARSGVGFLDLFDHDKICVTNINRQIHATTKTVGEYKVDAAKERALDINPDAVVNANRIFFLPEPESSGEILFYEFDYIIDAIDTIAGKIGLVLKAKEYNIPIISSMAAGNKVNPAMFEVADIYDTSICPIAKVMRKELKNHGVDKLKVVYSKEPVIKSTESAEPEDIEITHKRRIPGSNSFVPPVAGLIIASEVIKDLTGYNK